MDELNFAYTTKTNGTIAMDLSCGEGHKLIIGKTASMEGASEVYLVLIKSNDKDFRIVIEADETENSFVFNFEDIDAEKIVQSKLWLCYVAYAIGNKYEVKRIRKNGPSYSEQNKDINSNSLMWQDDICRYFGVLYEYDDIDDNRQLLVPYLDQTRNTLSLKICSKGKVDAIANHNLWNKNNFIDSFDDTFLISVVIAVYNAENYLEETVESVINQTIGFTKNVQLIMVDDGSTDNSPAICDRYKELYPDNIIVIHKENGGVASARNEGMNHAIGRYINFCDSDDIFSLNAFEEIASFFKENEKETDVVTIPLSFFENKTGGHWQNYKFEKGSRVINLFKEYTASDMFCNASFFKREVACKFEYDGTLPKGEDLKYVTQVLMEKMTLGVVDSCVYWYRRRESNDSLIDTSNYKRGSYIAYMDNLVFFLLEYSKEKFGYIPYFVQNTIMMDLQWRFHMSAIPSGVLTDEEEAAYIDNVKKTMNYISDEVINSQRKLNIDQKAQVFLMKYGEDSIYYNKTSEDIELYIRNNELKSFSEMVIKYDFIDINKNDLCVEGTINFIQLPIVDDLEVYLTVGDELYGCNIVENTIKEESNCFGITKKEVKFSGKLPLSSEVYGRNIQVCVRYDGILVTKKRYIYGKFCPVSGRFEHQYYSVDNKLIFGRNTGIRIELKSIQIDTKEVVLPKRLYGINNNLSDEKYEAEFIRELESLVDENKKVWDIRPTLSLDEFSKIVKYRYFAKTAKKDKPIWIISDRPNSIGDNGEAFFRYLMSKDNINVQPYFVIKEDCPGYEIMKEVGPTLIYGSEEHLMMHLIADVWVSSQGEDTIFNPFGPDAIYYRDILAKGKFVFLQHGVTKDDLSDWLSRYNKNITGFVTAAYREYDSILECDYHYNEENVWLTGFPRFDNMYNDTKNQVVLCPTWRLYLRDMTAAMFEQSQYYTFYSSLAKNERLKACLDKYKMSLAIKVHPQMHKYMDMYNNIPNLNLIGDDVTYRQVFAESNILVTDYSSNAMDFAYIGKPVVYCQFDKEEFFSGSHMYKAGYFDYEQDGFGPVTTDVESTVDAIISIIKNKCKLDKIYDARREKFFIKRDKNNCERVYKKICEIGE